jgi:Histidine kinase-, DNA gyrase B-, and HSP90-like ATPase
MSESTSSALAGHLGLGKSVDKLNVAVSYEIIRLFSEGLYKSPHKAIEELVTNSYDAKATQVHVSVPAATDVDGSLWVVDNGTGLDDQGFHNLWTVAKSVKADIVSNSGERAPVGQFGIGKLAAYVLAWRLTHVSKKDGEFRCTSMDFREVTKHPIDAKSPLSLELKTLTEPQAKTLLGELETRDPTAWGVLFGNAAAKTWTVAALSEFRDLASKIREGMLTWVLRSGLPIASDFSIYVNGQELESAQSTKASLASVEVGGPDDQHAESFGFRRAKGGIIHPKLGQIVGRAQLFEQPLTDSKSAQQYHRNHGFFIRVRKRVINLEDELFGLETLNHAVWSRFVMVLEADGLRDYLLSSREGVRDLAVVEDLRKYLRATFNALRSHYDGVQNKKLAELDVAQLLDKAPRNLVSEPLANAVRDDIADTTRTLHYIKTPENLRRIERAFEDVFGRYQGPPIQEVFVTFDGCLRPTRRVRRVSARTEDQRRTPVRREADCAFKGQSSAYALRLVGGNDRCSPSFARDRCDGNHGVLRGPRAAIANARR